MPSARLSQCPSNQAVACYGWPSLPPPEVSVHGKDGASWTVRCLNRPVRTLCPERSRRPRSRGLRAGSCGGHIAVHILLRFWGNLYGRVLKQSTRTNAGFVDGLSEEKWSWERNLKGVNRGNRLSGLASIRPEVPWFVGVLSGLWVKSLGAACPLIRDEVICNLQNGLDTPHDVPSQSTVLDRPLRMSDTRKVLPRAYLKNVTCFRHIESIEVRVTRYPRQQQGFC